MATGLSEVDVANLALDRLHEAFIVSLDEDKDQARVLKRNFGPYRDALLRAHPWNFALTRAALAKETATPAFGWDYQYLVPADCLRLLPLRSGGELNGRRLTFEFENGRILTDQGAPLKVRYIRRVTDVGKWDNIFVMLLATDLAIALAQRITGKRSYAEDLKTERRDLLRGARLTDALEGGTPERASMVVDAIDVR